MYMYIQARSLVRLEHNANTLLIYRPTGDLRSPSVLGPTDRIQPPSALINTSRKSWHSECEEGVVVECLRVTCVINLSHKFSLTVIQTCCYWTLGLTKRCFIWFPWINHSSFRTWILRSSIRNYIYWYPITRHLIFQRKTPDSIPLY